MYRCATEENHGTTTTITRAWLSNQGYYCIRYQRPKFIKMSDREVLNWKMKLDSIKTIY